MAKKVNCQKLLEMYEALAARVEALEQDKAKLEAENEIKSKTIEHLTKRCDKLEDENNHLEQYTRRTNLRIHGVKVAEGQESNDDVLKIVEEVHKDIGVAFDRKEIFRAHRVGKKNKQDNGETHQSIIVKFRSWDKRTALYRARPTLKKPTESKRYKTIGLDLTTRNLTLLDMARSKIKERRESGTETGVNFPYAFADVNCNLVVRLGDSKFKYFSNNDELIAVF